MAPTRRHVLTGGLLGAGLFAAGGIGLGLRPGADHPVPALQAFDATAFRTLQAFAAQVCPGDPPAFPSGADIGVAELVDAHVATLHPTDQQELNQALWLLENALAGTLLHGRTVPFTRATSEQQRSTLEAWRTSRLAPLRKAYKALRSLVASSYYSHPKLYAAMGYPGPPDFGQATAPALQPVQQLGDPS